MALVCPCRSKLAQLVAYHVLADKYRDMLSAVVYGDCVPNHLREYRRCPRPSLHNRFRVRPRSWQQFSSSAFLPRKALSLWICPYLHPPSGRFSSILSYFWFLLFTINLFDLFFFERVLRPSAGLPHGVIGDGRPIGDLPHHHHADGRIGFITLPRTVGLQPMWRFLPALPILMFS